MTVISGPQAGLQAAVSILSAPRQSGGTSAGAQASTFANPRDEVSLSGLAQQMMKLRDANKAPEGAPTATVGIVRAANGQEILRINENGGVVVNIRGTYEMLGGDWSDVEARRQQLSELHDQWREMSHEERIKAPKLPGAPGAQSISEFLYGAEFVSFSQAVQGADSIEGALAKIQAFMPSGSGYTIEAVFERPQMPAEDAEMLAAKAAADAWRNSLKRDDERSNGGIQS
jgi:hypothetical protein